MATKRFPHRPEFLDFKTDPERDAYYLGFFYADGCNSEKVNRVSIYLAGKDEAFLKSLYDTIYVTPKEPYRSTVKGHSVIGFAITSKELSQRLAALGAMARKTFILKWPTFLTPDLERHFIRGYFDGDGSCLHMKRKDSDKLCRAAHIPGTLDFLTGLQKAIERYTGLSSGIIPFGKIHLLYIGGNRRTLTFMEWLYTNASFYMGRKRDRYLLLKKDMKDLDDSRTYILYHPNRDAWAGRLPNRYKRVGTGYAFTYEEALVKWQDAMDEVTATSFEEWFNKRPPQRKRGPTRQHVKERGLAEGRYRKKQDT